MIKFLGKKQFWEFTWLIAKISTVQLSSYSTEHLTLKYHYYNLSMAYQNLFYLKEICRVLIGWWPLDKFPYPMARLFNTLFRLKLPFDRINTYPTASHGIWDLSHTSVSYIPLSFASWDIITSVWDKSPHPMAGCWISYIIPHWGDYIPQGQAKWDIWNQGVG